MRSNSWEVQIELLPGYAGRRMSGESGFEGLWISEIDGSTPLGSMGAELVHGGFGPLKYSACSKNGWTAVRGKNIEFTSYYEVRLQAKK